MPYRSIVLSLSVEILTPALFCVIRLWHWGLLHITDRTYTYCAFWLSYWCDSGGWGYQGQRPLGWSLICTKQSVTKNHVVFHTFFNFTVLDVWVDRSLVYLTDFFFKSIVCITANPIRKGKQFYCHPVDCLQLMVSFNMFRLCKQPW